MGTTKVKEPTNEQAFKALFADLSTIEVALLRERTVYISELTAKSVKEHPENWANPIIHPHAYVVLHEKITKHLGFEK